MYKWDLSSIYSSVGSFEFENDFKEYNNKIEALNKWAEENLTENSNQCKKIEYYLNAKNDLCKFCKLHIFVQLSLSTDLTNIHLGKIMDRLENADVKVNLHEALFKRFLLQINNLDELISSNKVLYEHKYFLNRTQKAAKHLLPLEIEETIVKMKTSGSIMWKKQWEQITSTLKNKVITDGKEEEMTLTMLRNLAYSDNAKNRYNAYKAELAAYKKIDTAGAFSLNGIKNEVLTISKMRGYSSPLAMTLEESRINEDVLNTMFSAIKEELPYFRKYLKAKGRLMGNENGIAFYDLFAPIGKSKSGYTYEDACEIIINAFSSFSYKLAAFAENAFKNNWIDVYPKEGKSGGGFCEVIHPTKESRILVNFSGSFNDIITIAHELGHAYHDSCLYDTSELNAFYPMPIAETASTFCETIVNKYMFSALSDEEKIFVLEKDISESTQVIVDIYSRFIFEESVFVNRERGFLSSDELCSLMENAQFEAYGDGLDSDFMHKYMWLCKCHYYDADFNYYNFPYAFGLLLAKGLYSKYLSNKEIFVPAYDEFLSKSSTNDLIDLCKTMNINLTDKKFWKSGLKMLEDDIDVLLSFIENKS